MFVPSPSVRGRPTMVPLPRLSTWSSIARSTRRCLAYIARDKTGLLQGGRPKPPVQRTLDSIKHQGKGHLSTSASTCKRESHRRLDKKKEKILEPHAFSAIEKTTGSPFERHFVSEQQRSCVCVSPTPPRPHYFMWFFTEPLLHHTISDMNKKIKVRGQPYRYSQRSSPNPAGGNK
ncbi:unnamed protein product [Ectocarpus sp. 12 AP-2014]